MRRTDSDIVTKIVSLSSKSDGAFRTISEVSADLGVPQYVLRFWESKFSQIRPIKRSGGRRYYRVEDVDLLRKIRNHLYDDGYTIKGVQKVLLRWKRGDCELGLESSGVANSSSLSLRSEASGKNYDSFTAAECPAASVGGVVVNSCRETKDNGCELVGNSSVGRLEKRSVLGGGQYTQEAICTVIAELESVRSLLLGIVPD